LPYDVASLNSRAGALVNINAPHARSLAEQAVALASATSDAAGRLQALRHLGSACHVAGDLRAAVRAFAQGLDAARQLHDREAEMVCTAGVAASLSCLGDLDGALEQFLNALALARELQRGPAVAKLLGNIGFVYEGFGDDARALVQYKAAYREKRRLSEPLGVSLMNIACIHDRSGRLRLARRLFMAALEKLRLQGDRQNESHALANLALVQGRLGEPVAAMTSMNAALQVARDFGLQRQEARALARLGQLQRQASDLMAARDAFSAALALAEPAGFARELRATYDGLAAVQDGLGDAIGAEHTRRRLRELDEDTQRRYQAQHTEALSLRAEVERLTNDLARSRSHAAEVARENRRLAQANALLRGGLHDPWQPGRDEASHIALTTLSRREREVLKLLIAGLSNAQIGERLAMSRNTARTHVAAIFGKLRVKTRAQAVAKALRNGWG
jgi:ATP/maltotriose-dependent transcriptional regulator MalT